jgi:hypothetical protein
VPTEVVVATAERRGTGTKANVADRDPAFPAGLAEQRPDADGELLGCPAGTAALDGMDASTERVLALLCLLEAWIEGLQPELGADGRIGGGEHHHLGVSGACHQRGDGPFALFQKSVQAWMGKTPTAAGCPVMAPCRATRSAQ